MPAMSSSDGLEARPALSCRAENAEDPIAGIFDPAPRGLSDPKLLKNRARKLRSAFSALSARWFGPPARKRQRPATSANAASRGAEQDDKSVAAMRVAEEASTAKTRLLAAASHDLRQPLQAIGLWVELLREQTQDADVRRTLGKIQETARGAEEVLNALLDITRLDLGVIQVRVTDIAVSDLFNHLAVAFGGAANDKGLALRLRTSAAIARSDPALLERILGNFVGNAIRHTARGGVLVGCRQHGAHLSLEIWDTGPGIPEDRLHDVFEEFVQLGTQGRDRSRGLGLGLSIAQRTAALLGHPIRTTSRLGTGSCFRVEVPVGVRQGLTLAASDCEESEAAIYGSFIVFVEDEREQREAMASLLRNWGCHVVVAASAADAIEELRGHLRMPNLLISDYRLGRSETGLHAIRAIRTAAGDEVPALMLTGDRDAFLDTSIEAAGISLLRKPVQPEQFRKNLAELLLTSGPPSV